MLAELRAGLLGAASTHGNVLGAAAAAKDVSAREVVVVTSRWLRELACWLLVPVQIALARRTR